MNEGKASQIRRHRGLVLQLAHTNREDQLSRMDDVELWGALLDLRIEVGQNTVLSLLQDLKDRGYLRFDESRDRLTGRMRCRKIELCGAGCDLVEHTRTDEAVLIP